MNDRIVAELVALSARIDALDLAMIQLQAAIRDLRRAAK